MRAVLLLLILLCPVASAQLEEGQPLSNGIVSLIEDSFNPSETDPRRATPFVEMIDTAALGGLQRGRARLAELPDL